MGQHEDDLREIGGTAYRRTSVDSRDARRLVDLQSILDDLHRVVLRCEMLTRPELSDDLRQAVWESAVITYGRCFGEGKSFGKPRRRVTAGHFVNLEPKHLLTHEHLIRERNRHVAHRDDELGEIAKVEFIEPVSGDGVRALAVVINHRISPYAELTEAIALAEALIERLQPIFQTENDRLLDRLVARRTRSD